MKITMYGMCLDYSSCDFILLAYEYAYIYIYFETRNLRRLLYEIFLEDALSTVVSFLREIHAMYSQTNQITIYPSIRIYFNYVDNTL